MSAAPTLRVAYAGTPEFAAVALRALHDAGHALVLVLTQPDRPAGRGLKLQPSAVKLAARERGLAVAQPRGLRLDGRYADDAAAARLALQAARPDVLVVAAYGLILPAWVLALPPLGCINLHASLLPRWRGAAPVQRAIEAGDARTGVTLMQMDQGLDTGAIVAMRALPIGAGATAASLTAELAALGATMVVDLLAAPRAERFGASPQPAEGITYAAKIDKGEAAIDWSGDAEAIERRLRAFDPFPGCSFVHQGQAIKLWRARLAEGAGAAAGTVVGIDAGAPVVACGTRALALETVQRPGGKRVPASSLGLAPGAALGR